MSQEKLVEQVQQLRNALGEIEKPLAGGDVPLAVLEDFKMAIDHTRMTLWAIFSTPQTDPYEATATIVRLRQKRTVEMCRQIILDINSSEITVESSELKPLHAALQDTLDRIERLYHPRV